MSAQLKKISPYVLALTATIACTGDNFTQCPLPHGKWAFNPALSDEFEGKRVDQKKWNITKKSIGWETCWTEKNVIVSDGKLHIMLIKEKTEMDSKKAEYTAGMLKTFAAAKYGYFEAKIKFTSAFANNAFWFCAQNSFGWGYNEIDIMEGHAARQIREKTYGEVKNLFGNTIWVEKPQHQKVFNADRSLMHETDTDLAADYHTYGFEWDENNLKFYFDGKCLYTRPNRYNHYPLNLIFNLTAYKEYGGFPFDTDLPASMDIEYVRAWKRTDVTDTRIWDYTFKLPDSIRTNLSYLIPDADNKGKLKVFIKPDLRIGVDYFNEAYYKGETADNIKKEVRINDKSGKSVFFIFEWERGDGDDAHSGYVAKHFRIEPEKKLRRGEAEDFIFTGENGKDIILSVIH